MSFNVGPRVVSATGGSIKRVGNYRIHTFPSELVTDGLVLNLDAGDPRSYPGSGTSWTDLSGNGNNGTFGASTAAPTYNNANGGSLVFDGTNDYISISNPTNFTGGTRDFSVSFWIKYSSSGNSQPDRIFEVTGGGTWTIIYYANNGIMLQTNDGSNWDAGVISTTGAIGTNTWRHVVFTRTGTIGRLYIDGTLNATGTFNSSINDTGSNFFVGGSAAGYFAGNISSVQFYSNKCLSPAEVAQNYDALKVRYTSYTNTFTPTCGGGSGKVEVLCVAGGGGGGREAGGGGGAGGLIYNSAFTVNSNIGIALTVGAGGTGASSSATQSPGTGFNGANSIFSSLTSIGGGGGAVIGAPSPAGANGGSGGGGNRNAVVAPESIGSAGGTGVSGQGFAGGAGGNYDGYTTRGGGGGGSGGVGQTAPATAGGAGGIGLAYNISGISQFYAGGGAGGSGSNYIGGLGGSGIGGNGSSGATINGYTGIPNTGSGGGGGGSTGGSGATFGGNGSNGIIIVRYPATDYNVELLVIGGGGGGGGNAGDSWNAGGGGAGGLIYYSSYPISAGTKYSVTVGVGGTAGISTSSNNGSTTTQGVNGGNSIFGPLVAIGGGGGGASSGYTNPGIKNQGLNGGSGGGSGVNYGGGVHPGGFGVSGQGNSGGQGDNTGSGYSGGGGGAGGPGTGPGVHNVTNFGPGLVFSITGSSVSYAQGGQGGRDPVTNAEANSGTGGDGARSAVNTLGQSGAGGSGIIIIAYQGPQRGVGGTVDTTSRPGYTLHKFTTTGTDFFIP